MKKAIVRFEVQRPIEVSEKKFREWLECVVYQIGTVSIGNPLAHSDFVDVAENGMIEWR